ncbi:hypothetical protein GCM10009747_10600 [Agromyces humatus]|uniref:AbiEi antitoxin C-terminal domain-containing protein n=1 Tax=Agromyces humatus TaxID=279573 RepID=A0ABP4WK76_9MICO
MLGTDDLPLAELCAARIDGDLFAIDEGWAPIDEPDLPSLRAAVVALRVSRSLIIERLSAAWVYDALDTAPRTAQFCVPHRSRIAAIADRRITIREVVLTDDEVAELGGVSCTTPARTAFDLLRETSLPDADSVGIVARLLAPRPRLESQIRERLARAQRMPHRARALVRLDHAVETASSTPVGSTQPSLTR